MSSIINKMKNKVSGDKNSGEKDSEQAFSIQPHPAKTNDPADLQPREGLRSGGAADAFHARDPHVPNDDIKNNLPEPASRDEMRARQAELNQ